MKKSKLEIYEEVLSALADKPLTVDAIAYACSIDCITISQRLDFLVKNSLVEERDYNKKKCYALTSRGMAINKTITITKKLERLQTSIKIIAESLHTLPALTEQRSEKKENK